MEKNKIPGDGVVTGWGTVNGRKTFVFAKELHRVRRLALRDARAENHKAAGYGDEGEGADHRPL